MILVCPRCVDERRPAVVGERWPFDVARLIAALCGEHARAGRVEAPMAALVGFEDPPRAL